MAGELLGHAADMLADDKATPDQLRFALARMSESLRDVHRIAESRGARLPVRSADEDDDRQHSSATGPSPVGPWR